MCGWECRALLAAALTVLLACGARSQLEALGEAAGSQGGAAADGGESPEGGFGGGGAGGGPLTDCTDPDVTYIYLVTETLGFYAFKPQIGELEYRGQLNCDNPGVTPFSMGVSREGRAHVVYDDGSLWEVDVTDASCEPTPFAPGQNGFVTFGMGYALADDMQGETLYVSDIDYDAGTTKGLGRIDLDAYQLEVLAPLVNPLGYRIELTGRQTQLYAFIIDSQVGGGHLAEVDKTSGALSDVVPVQVGTDIGSWHFAFWGGAFYFFTESGNAGFTNIRRYDPAIQTLDQVGMVPEPVVGAGASTCAPQ